MLPPAGETDLQLKQEESLVDLKAKCKTMRFPFQGIECIKTT